MKLRVLLVLLVLAPVGASAQSRDPAAPSDVRDLVAAVSDTMHLRGIEREYTRSAAAAAGLSSEQTAATASIAAGLTALRLWAVTGERAHARRSREHFDRAARNDPANAWAHYGHALSLEAEMDREPGRFVTHINALRDVGMDPVSRARRALERAVALDPTLPGATELLARYAVETRDEEGLLQARTSFQMSVAASRSAGALLGVAAMSRELGDYADAAGAARRAARADGSAASYLSLAMSLALMEDSLPAAGIAYTEALRLADATMLEQLWDHASLLQTVRDSAAWSVADAPERHAVLRTFWDVRGALAGLSGGERAAEHYRRMAIARRDFPRRGMFGAAPGNALELRKVSESFDDRGVIFVRHGTPEHTYGAPPLESYITWYYRAPDGDPLSYHFFRSADAGSSKDYLLMYNLPCAMDFTRASLDRRLIALTRQRCDPLTVRSVSAEIARDARRALRTDSHNPAFDVALPFHFDWYTFRDGGSTELLMAVGMPLERLPDSLRSLRMRLSMVDTAAMAIVHATRVAERIAFDGTERGRILRTHLAMADAPGPRTFRIDIRDAADPRTGQIYGGDIVLPDYSGDTLMVSDVMLAEQSDSGLVVRGDQRLAPAPAQTFRDGQFRVYYEVYNMPPGMPYSTELTIVPFRRSGLRESIRRLFTGNESVQLRFEDAAPADAPSTLQRVHDITAPYREGTWLLRLTITSEAGTIVRERRFTLEER